MDAMGEAPRAPRPVNRGAFKKSTCCISSTIPSTLEVKGTDTDPTCHQPSHQDPFVACSHPKVAVFVPETQTVNLRRAPQAGWMPWEKPRVPPDLRPKDLSIGD